MYLNSYSKYGKKYSYLNIWKIFFSKRNYKKQLIASSQAVNSRREILLGRWVRRILLNFVHFCTVSNLCVLVAQSCLTLCDPMDCTLPGSSVHGILQARKLEWVAISFSTSPVSLYGQADSLPLHHQVPNIYLESQVWVRSYLCPPGSSECVQPRSREIPQQAQLHWPHFFLPSLSNQMSFSSSLEWSEKGRWKGIDSLPICWRRPKTLLSTKSECEKLEQKFTLIACNFQRQNYF